MKDVFILGAGFSKAIHSEMPTLEELTKSIAQRLKKDKPSTLQSLEHLDRNIELWMTYLSQRQPWLTENENDANNALAGRIRKYIGEEIVTQSALASREPNVPRWLLQIIKAWHHNQATVITLNYDTLVERAAKSVGIGAEIFAAHMYPPYFSNIQERFGGGLLGEGSSPTFSFLKLHGSINWHYSGRDDFFENLYSSLKICRLVTLYGLILPIVDRNRKIRNC